MIKSDTSAKERVKFVKIIAFNHNLKLISVHII